MSFSLSAKECGEEIVSSSDVKKAQDLCRNISKSTILLDGESNEENSLAKGLAFGALRCFQGIGDSLIELAQMVPALYDMAVKGASHLPDLYDSAVEQLSYAPEYLDAASDKFSKWREESYASVVSWLEDNDDPSEFISKIHQSHVNAAKKTLAKAKELKKLVEFVSERVAIKIKNEYSEFQCLPPSIQTKVLCGAITDITSAILPVGAVLSGSIKMARFTSKIDKVIDSNFSFLKQDIYPKKKPKPGSKLNSAEKKDLLAFSKKMRSGKKISASEEAKYLALLQRANPLGKVMKRGLSKEEALFTENALKKIYSKEYISAEDLLRASGNLKSRTPPLIMVSGQNDMAKIKESGRIWGQTEGHVYAASKPIKTKWDRAKSGVHDEKEGTVLFSGESAALFKNHEVKGIYSGIKNLAGQKRGPFGDIIIEEFREEVVAGKTVFVITKARRAKDAANKSEKLHAGQSTLWAGTKATGRVVGIDGGIGAGSAGTGFLLWLNSPYAE